MAGRKKGGRRKLRWALLALLALILSVGFVPFPLGSTGKSPKSQEEPKLLRPRKRLEPAVVSPQEQDRIEGRRAALRYFWEKGDLETLSSFIHLLLAKDSLPGERALGQEWGALLEKRRSAGVQVKGAASEGESEGESGFLPTKKRKKVRKAAPATKQRGQSLGLKKATGK